MKNKRSFKQFISGIWNSKLVKWLGNFVKKLFFLIFNPRFLLCFGIGWLITNGWAYVMMSLGAYFKIEWMMAVSGAYLTFLWFPFSPEKVATVAIALFLLRLIFPKDEKTLGILRELYEKAKEEAKVFKKKRQDKQSGKEKDKNGFDT